MNKTARTRERQLQDDLYLDKVKTYCNGSPSESVPVLIENDKDTCHDFVVDNYYKRINAGEIINNPCNYTRTTRTHSGTGSVTYGTTCAVRSTSVGPISSLHWNEGWTPDMIDCPISDDEARAKLVAIANIDSTPYAFGEDALELKETARFLRNPVLQIYNLSVEFRRAFRKRTANLKDLHELLKEHAGVYLQFQFALSPLIRSCIDALDAYQSIPSQQPPRQSARGIVKSDNFVWEDEVEGWNYHLYDLTRKKESDVKASILYTVSNPIKDWRYRLGFRPKDLPTTLWQVVPLSFMVDRLLDISSFSKGIINLGDPRVTILSGCYRQKLTDTMTYSLVGRDLANTTVNSSDTDTHTSFSYVRSVWSPSVSDTVPQVNLGNLVNTATKIVDLIALSIGNFDPFNPRRN